MRTKIRLTIHLLLQTLLFLGLFLQTIYTSISIWTLLVVYGIGLGVWQSIYASYMIQQHADWYLTRYLKRMKMVAKISIWLLIFTLLAALLSLGYLHTPLFLLLQYLAYGLGIVLLLLAVPHFIRSIIQTYYYYYKQPRSFWDL